MTRRSIGRYRAIAVVAAYTLASTGCNHNVATIHYSQPANAALFDSDPTGSPHLTTSSSPDLFAFYCINAIENNDSNAQDFNFALSKVVAGNDPGSVPGNTSFSYLVQTAPATLKVAAHTKSAPLGRIVIRVKDAGDPNALTAMLNLSYKSASGESVLIVRDGGANPPPVKFLDPASPVHPNNLPVCP